MKDNKQSIKQVELVLEHLKNGNNHDADEILKSLTGDSQSGLFLEIGKLTRELHDALNNFRLDSKMTELAGQDIPDAKERLEYVLTMTDEAANKTMDAVDQSSEISNEILQNSKDLLETWNKVSRKEISTGEFKVFFEDVGEFLRTTEDKTTGIGQYMTEILMAQGFQDLTGQVIKKVITLVHDVEESLVSTISMFGRMEDYHDALGTEKKHEKGVEGPVIDADKRDDVVTGQDDVDDLLSSLGF